MGYYLQIDDTDTEPVASLSGWGDAVKWVGTLPPSASALHHLALYGWEDDVPATLKQLKSAMGSTPPKAEQTKKTIDNLLSLLTEKARSAKVISITDGLGASD